MERLKKPRASYLSFFFFTFGGLLLIIYWWLVKISPQKLAFERQPVLSAKIAVFPKTIKINAVGIDLPVYPVKLEGKDWPLLENGAAYLVGSGQIGKLGNVVIYGHNRAGLFGSLKRIKTGDLVEVTDEEEQLWRYQVEQILLVSPAQVGILSNQDYPALTLYTCSGFWDQQRLVVVSRLQV